jgi:DNA-binding MarR family transcriptional regulator
MTGNRASAADVERLLRAYPRIFFACHQQHVRDPATKRVLSAHQASILDHLDEVDALALNDLARHMGVTAGTMSVAIDRLVSKGYVRRTRSREDQRRVELRLTEAGLRIREQQSVLEPQLVAALLDQMDADERTDALNGLQRLAQAADALASQKAGRVSRKSTSSTARRRS